MVEKDSPLLQLGDRTSQQRYDNVKTFMTQLKEQEEEEPKIDALQDDLDKCIDNIEGQFKIIMTRHENDFV